jgi:hypothetical protein
VATGRHTVLVTPQRPGTVMGWVATGRHNATKTMGKSQKRSSQCTWKVLFPILAGLKMSTHASFNNLCSDLIIFIANSLGDLNFPKIMSPTELLTRTRFDTYHFPQEGTLPSQKFKRLLSSGCSQQFTQSRIRTILTSRLGSTPSLSPCPSSAAPLPSASTTTSPA